MYTKRSFLVLSVLTIFTLVLVCFLRHPKELLIDIMKGRLQWSSGDKTQPGNPVQIRTKSRSGAAHRANDEKKRAALEDYVVSEIIKHPFSLDGVNSRAAKYYKLDPEQVEAIAKIAGNIRSALASDVSDNIFEIESSGEAERVLEYRASPVLADRIENRLREELTAIVDDDFAKASIKGLSADDRFLSGGRRNIRFAVNPHDISDPRLLKLRNTGAVIVRVLVTTPEGVPASSWEGNYENIRESWKIDLKL